MTQIEQLENALEQLKRYGQEQLTLEPNHPRNHFKYTIGCADAPDDLYTNSLKKAKSLCLEMCEKYNRMSVVEDSKTWKTVFSVCQDNFISGTLSVDYFYPPIIMKYIKRGFYELRSIINQTQRYVNRLC